MATIRISMPITAPLALAMALARDWNAEHSAKGEADLHEPLRIGAEGFATAEHGEPLNLTLRVTSGADMMLLEDLEAIRKWFDGVTLSVESCQGDYGEGTVTTLTVWYRSPKKWKK